MIPLLMYLDVLFNLIMQFAHADVDIGNLFFLLLNTIP